jgi:hypothetical protein
VASKEYIERLKLTVEHLHRCSAVFLRTERVKEIFQGQTIWEGSVEVFGLSRHPEAKTCYGWSQGEPEEFMTILELPPVKSAHDAVKVAIAHQVRRSRKG